MHALAGAVGVGVLFAWAPWFLSVLLVAGALYMAWIGLGLMRSSITVSLFQTAKSRAASTLLRQGFVTCILNPKAYLFVLAVYPQFMKPLYGPIWP